MRGAALLVALWAVAGCHKTPDGCASFGGQTCISLELRAPSGRSLSIDQVELGAVSGFQFSPEPYRTPATPLSSAVSLPVVVPILPGAGFAGGDFSFTVRGLRTGSAVGSAVVSGTVAASAHLALVATLEAGDFDMSGGDLGSDMMSDGGVVAVPRPLAPVSTGFVTTPQPTFRWALPAGVDGAAVEICKDRACTMVVQSFSVDSDHGTPPTALPSQVLFWRLHPRAGGVTLGGTSPTWQFTVGTPTGAAVSTSYGNTLDLDGDGRAELAIGAPGAPMAASAAGPGSAYVWRGDAQARSKLMTAAPNFILRDPDGKAGDKFGNSVVGVGDLDGDGFADLAVAAPCAPFNATCGAGKVHLYRGGPNALSAANPPPDLSVTAPGGATSFAISIAGVDLDGDGYSDLVVGAPPNVYVYRGGPAILDQPSAPTPAWTLTGSAQFGVVVANGGDIDGDGIGDVVMSTNNVINGAGGAYVYGGGAANGFSPGGSPMGLAIPAPSAAGATGGFGYSIDGAHDINGDGYSDVVIGVPSQGGSTGDGALYVFYGTASGPGMANPMLVQVAGGNGQEQMGASVAGLGDINGDGFADIAAGGPAYFDPAQPTLSGTGRVVVLTGTALSGTAPTFYRGQKADVVGTNMKSVGDLDGDGFADIIVQTPRYNGTVTNTDPSFQQGRIDVYFGGATGPTTAAVRVYGPDGMLGSFGY